VDRRPNKGGTPQRMDGPGGRCKARILALVSLFVLASCGKPGVEPPAGTTLADAGEVVLTVRVLLYVSDAGHSTAMGSGGMLYHPDWFDLAQCQVLEPKAYAGLRIEIKGWNRQGGLLDKRFQKEGAVVNIRCDPSRLAFASPAGPVELGQWEIAITGPGSQGQ